MSGDKQSVATIYTPKDKEKYGFEWESIIGHGHVKNEINAEFFFPVKYNYNEYKGIYTELPSGMLLYGPPGCGKTLFAKGLIRKLPQNVSMFAEEPSRIKGSFVGQTEKNIRELFKRAREETETKEGETQRFSVIFFDEFDSIAGNRNGGSESMRLSVNALLVEMDGIKGNEFVSVIAATNLPWNLDDAILRRLGTQILVNIPLAGGQNDFIKYTDMYLLKSYPHISDDLINKLSKRLLENILQRFANDNKFLVSYSDIENIIKGLLRITGDKVSSKIKYNNDSSSYTSNTSGFLFSWKLGSSIYYTLEERRFSPNLKIGTTDFQTLGPKAQLHKNILENLVSIPSEDEMTIAAENFRQTIDYDLYVNIQRYHEQKPLLPIVAK